MEIRKLKDFINLNAVGFFERMEALGTEATPTPWLPYVTSQELDKLYYLNNKERKVSDWWDDLAGETETGKDTIAGLLWDIYKTKWSHLFEIFKATYNPLENYDRYEDTTETTTRDGTETTEHNGQDETTRAPELTKELKRTGADTDKRSPDLTSTSETKNNTTDNTNKRAAFNSSEMLDTDGSHTTQTDKREDKETGTEEIEHKKGTTDTEEETGTETTTLTRGTNDTLIRDTTDTLRRTGRIHGNIGVTTAAQMMEGDKAAWEGLKLIEGMLMDDLNEQLTLAIYA